MSISPICSLAISEDVFELISLYFPLSQNLRDVHLMGTTVEYTCIDGYYLVGEKTAECKSDKTWTTPERHCKSKTVLI